MGNKKSNKKNNWRQMGLILSSEEEFDEIYERYINSNNCELCNEPYINNYDRHMDHIHFIDDKWGWFRNVICRICNRKKADNKMRIDNTSRHKLIHKRFRKNYKQGYTWEFRVYIDGKYKTIKSSIDLDFLIKFRDDWTKKNNYYT